MADIHEHNIETGEIKTRRRSVEFDQQRQQDAIKSDDEAAKVAAEDARLADRTRIADQVKLIADDYKDDVRLADLATAVNFLLDEIKQLKAR